jgi:hypothetical protein
LLYSRHDSQGNPIGFITDLAGNLLYDFTVNSPDKNPPKIFLSIGAVHKDKLYIMFSKKLETSSELISKPEAINLLDWVSRYLRKSSNFTKSSSSIVAPVLANFNSYFKNTIQTGDLQAIYYNLVGKFKRLEVKHVEYP